MAWLGGEQMMGVLGKHAAYSLCADVRGKLCVGGTFGQVHGRCSICIDEYAVETAGTW